MSKDCSRLPDDEAVLARVRGGDTAAFGVLWERHEPPARALARYLAHSAQDVDDIVAEAFAKVLNAIENGAGPTESFRPYLMMAVRRTAWRRCGARRDNPLPDDLEDDRLAVLDRDGDDDEGMACAAWRSLPPRWQTVLWQTEILGRTSVEVGDQLGISPNAAAALIGRARHGLRRAYLMVELENTATRRPPVPSVPAQRPAPVPAPVLIAGA